MTLVLVMILVPCMTVHHPNTFERGDNQIVQGRVRLSNQSYNLVGNVFMSLSLLRQSMGSRKKLIELEPSFPRNIHSNDCFVRSLPKPSLSDRGVVQRQKIRIRTYNPESPIAIAQRERN